MGIELKQYLQLSQQLVITPQLQQAIKLLQLSHLELKQEIDAQLMENPCLEADQATPEPDQEMLKALVRSSLESSDGGFFRGAGAMNEDLPSYENTVAKPQSLTDHLMWQLNNSQLDEKQLNVAHRIIGNVNEDGYLTQSIDVIAQKCAISEQDAEAVLFMIQQFDPVGVASRDLQECLLNQLWAIEIKTDMMRLAEKILEKHFNLFLKRRMSLLVRKLKVPKEQVVEACHLISQLNPKPGSAYHETDQRQDAITPDVYVANIGGKLLVSLNDDGLPKLRVSKQYLEILEGKAKKKDLEYVYEKIRGAVWFIKSIEQRQHSIYKVAQSLLKHQEAFFEHGVSHLVPLVLKQVADDIGLHESTVSRVTKGKYMRTPHGLFEMKFFFNSKIQTVEEDVGSQTVKLKLREIVADETPENPLSDEQLRQRLEDHGIIISRRTIAKYREMLGILPSSARKKRF